MHVLIQKKENTKKSTQYYGFVKRNDNTLILDNEHHDALVATERLNLKAITNISKKSGKVPSITFMHKDANYEISDYTGKALDYLDEQLMA
jgi:uracil phosphoribosyltransferase